MKQHFNLICVCIAKLISHPRVQQTLEAYDAFIGVKDVRAAQAEVLKTEQAFLNSREKLRQLETKLIAERQAREKVTTELEFVRRGDEKFITLVNKEHELLKQERALQEELNALEQQERDQFTLLSSQLRDSHELERLQMQRTKYWSLIGSMMCATVGVLGATWNNYRRNAALSQMFVQEMSMLREESVSLRSDVIGRMGKLENRIDHLLSAATVTHTRPTGLDKVEEASPVSPSVPSKEPEEPLPYADQEPIPSSRKSDVFMERLGHAGQLLTRNPEVVAAACLGLAACAVIFVLQRSS